MSERKKVVLLGASLCAGNRGINALTRGEIRLAQEIYGEDVEVTILSFTVKTDRVHKIVIQGKTVEVTELAYKKNDVVMNYFLSLVGLKSRFITMMKEADAVWDISEGDRFSDIYGNLRYLQHFMIKQTANRASHKLVIMPQTIGPFQRGWAKSTAKRILKRAHKVYVRDNVSRQCVVDELKAGVPVTYCPDMAFYMPKNETVTFPEITLNPDKKTVGINISALLYNGGYSKSNMFNIKVEYGQMVDRVVEWFHQKNYQIVLIPHVMTENFEVEDDYRLCLKLCEKYKGKSVDVQTVAKMYKEDEIKALISKCDVFVGSRMHACIGAISTCVPAIPLAYSRKFIGIWKELELSQCVIDLTSAESIDEILARLADNEKEIETVGNILKEKIPMIEEKIHTLFQS